MRQSHKVVKHTQTRLALKGLKYNYQVSKEMQSWPAVYLFFFLQDKSCCKAGALSLQIKYQREVTSTENPRPWKVL